MCGICGFNWEDKKLIKEMAHAMSYRGPDQEGYYTDKNISLAHKRLSIIDLSENGKQPMVNEDGSIVIIFNGELYNFQDIKPELEKKGHRFNSDSDTEVIIHAYEEYGFDCLKLFNGMFAFAIWDSKKKILFLARDRLGIKPLYYYHKDSKFIFASEIKSILSSNEIKKTLNENCLKQIIYYEYPIRGDTLIENIFQLEPAHYMILKDNKINFFKYWNLESNETCNDEKFYINKLTDLLSSSVKRMLISDVPVGISLSGGIDSSVIVALASKFKKEPIKTFTAGFDIPEDEYAAARLVAEHCKTDHTELHLGSKDYVTDLIKTLWHMEFPFSRPAMVSVYDLYKGISKSVKVSLCGEGSDELFGGYNRYEAYTELPPEKNILNKEYYEILKNRINMPFQEKTEYISSSVFDKDKKEFFKEDILKIPRNLNVMNTFGRMIKECKNGDGSQLNKALLYELKTEIPYFHCNKLDKNSMAHSHEVRVPYLDHTVVEFAMTIPARYKFYGEDKKIILQKLASPLLPKEIVYRKKLPMVTPLSEYFKKELLDFSETIFSNPRLEREYYNISRIKKLIKQIKERTLIEEQRKTKDNSFRQLLLLMNIELWKKLFIENDFKKEPSFFIDNYI
jgi:asparagine synthase (glutamine-hydrolysing)